MNRDSSTLLICFTSFFGLSKWRSIILITVILIYLMCDPFRIYSFVLSY